MSSRLSKLNDSAAVWPGRTIPSTATVRVPLLGEMLARDNAHQHHRFNCHATIMPRRR